MWTRSDRRRLSRCIAPGAAGLLLGLGMGCTGIASRPTEVIAANYFEIPDPEDIWSPKIEGWQRRERFDADLLAPLDRGPAVESAGFSDPDLGPPVDPGDESGLRAKYFRFRAERKRAMAADVAEWIQAEAKHAYREDGAVDHWATFEETLARGGDDCDGLELLVFHALRDLGFAETEVYRAIVVRSSDGQHHMVTLWFEDPSDPWVIDPTGAMTLGMPRMSELPAWVPIKVFTDRLEYTVRTRPGELAINP